MNNEFDNLGCDLEEAVDMKNRKLLEHEICNSLNVIIGFGELVKQEKMSEHTHEEYMQHIIHSAKRLLAFTNHILERPL